MYQWRFFHRLPALLHTVITHYQKNCRTSPNTPFMIYNTDIALNDIRKRWSKQYNYYYCYNKRIFKWVVHSSSSIQFALHMNVWRLVCCSRFLYAVFLQQSYTHTGLYNELTLGNIRNSFFQHYAFLAIMSGKLCTPLLSTTFTLKVGMLTINLFWIWKSDSSTVVKHDSHES